ncbi:YaaC family protein [Cytobacillus suaedae]|nr:YaaC family protein [Cytobacillus suaedae]
MKDQHQIWHSFSAFHSATTIQNLLLRCYKRQNFEDADKKSYDNCYPFIYYLEHGQNYYQLATNAPLAIKPVLLFYGMVQLLKACLLTVDPQYPESTSVLAHGVSTRKRKKQSYEFSQDEVKIQKNGLFTHFSEKMFHVKHLDGEKYSMNQLLRRIPELSNLFKLHYQLEYFCKIEKAQEDIVRFPISLLDKYHMTSRRFHDFISEALPFQIEASEEDQNVKDYLSFKIVDRKQISPIHSSPLYYHLYEDSYYVSTNRDDLVNFPEIMVHYLLLYNLSMISRYETEWWSELLHSYSSNDYPFINQFLTVSAEKVPYLLYLFLNQQIKND